LNFIEEIRQKLREAVNEILKKVNTKTIRE